MHACGFWNNKEHQKYKQNVKNKLNHLVKEDIKYPPQQPTHCHAQITF